MQIADEGGSVLRWGQWQSFVIVLKQSKSCLDTSPKFEKCTGCMPMFCWVSMGFFRSFVGIALQETFGEAGILCSRCDFLKWFCTKSRKQKKTTREHRLKDSRKSKMHASRKKHLTRKWTTKRVEELIIFHFNTLYSANHCTRVYECTKTQEKNYWSSNKEDLELQYAMCILDFLQWTFCAILPSLFEQVEDNKNSLFLLCKQRCRPHDDPFFAHVSEEVLRQSVFRCSALRVRSHGLHQNLWLQCALKDRTMRQCVRGVPFIPTAGKMQNVEKGLCIRAQGPECHRDRVCTGGCTRLVIADLDLNHDGHLPLVLSLLQPAHWILHQRHLHLRECRSQHQHFCLVHALADQKIKSRVGFIKSRKQLCLFVLLYMSASWKGLWCVFPLELPLTEAQELTEPNCQSH